jgi:hypothetical protein
MYHRVDEPGNNPFWTATESKGFWDSPPALVKFGKTGLWVEHAGDNGHSRLHADQSQRTKDPRYAGPSYDTADMEWRYPHLFRTS